MGQVDSRTAAFESHRRRIRSIAYRMVGTGGDAEDAVQEAWLRYNRADVSEVANLEAWLTTVVSRICLNMLEAKRVRPQATLDAEADTPADDGTATDPEHRSMVADSIGSALMVVLDTVGPAERVAFVLHDIFAVPFDEIAPIVDRSTPATRQLASRARKRVRGRNTGDDRDEIRKAIVVDAFLAASRLGDFDALMRLLDPDVVLRADEHAAAYGTAAHAGGTDAVKTFSRYARGARPAVLDGAAAAVWLVGAQPRVVYEFTLHEGRITAIDLVGDPARLASFDLRVGEAW